MQNSKPKSFDDITDKLIFEIFCFCDYDSFLNASQVCVRWNRVISDNIDFFSSYFEDNEAPSDEVTEENKEPEPEDDKPYTEEQEAIVEQLTTLDARKQYHEMLGVAIGAEEDDIRNQYKKVIPAIVKINFCSWHFWFTQIRTKPLDQ